MSFLKSLFGGRRENADAAPTAKARIEHKGFVIEATPFKEAGQFQTCGVISKEVDGARKEHRFVRADRHASETDAVDFSLAKGRQIVDEQGDRLLG